MHACRPPSGISEPAAPKHAAGLRSLEQQSRSRPRGRHSARPRPRAHIYLHANAPTRVSISTHRCRFRQGRSPHCIWILCPPRITPPPTQFPAVRCAAGAASCVLVVPVNNCLLAQPARVGAAARMGGAQPLFAFRTAPRGVHAADGDAMTDFEFAHIAVSRVALGARWLARARISTALLPPHARHRKRRAAPRRPRYYAIIIERTRLACPCCVAGRRAAFSAPQFAQFTV